MDSFSIALVAFVLLHMGVSATGLRARITQRIGEGLYRGLFSLASLGLLAWLIYGYGAMRYDPFDPLSQPWWAPPPWLRHLAMGLIALGVTLAVAGVLTPGPTLAGFEGALNKAEPATGILRITRHPFLWGVTLWAAGHLMVNSERFALMLFGALGLMVLFGTRSIDRKGRARNPEAWERFAAVTSNLPFAAIAQGRNSFKFGETWLRLLAGLLVAVLIALFHEKLIGISALSTRP